MPSLVVPSGSVVGRTMTSATSTSITPMQIMNAPSMAMNGGFTV
jgi:hypothetical protein